MFSVDRQCPRHCVALSGAVRCHRTERSAHVYYGPCISASQDRRAALQRTAVREASPQPDEAHRVPTLCSHCGSPAWRRRAPGSTAGRPNSRPHRINDCAALQVSQEGLLRHHAGRRPQSLSARHLRRARPRRPYPASVCGSRASATISTQAHVLERPEIGAIPAVRDRTTWPRCRDYTLLFVAQKRLMEFGTAPN